MEWVWHKTEEHGLSEQSKDRAKILHLSIYHPSFIYISAPDTDEAYQIKTEIISYLKIIIVLDTMIHYVYGSQYSQVKIWLKCLPLSAESTSQLI